MLILAETAEMRLTGRGASALPGRVGAKVAGRDPEADPKLVQRLNPIVHWIQGTALGAVRGLRDLAGLGASAATAVFYLLVWSGDALLYRTLGLALAPSNWTRAELRTDLYGKGGLAVATSGAYILLDNAI